MVRLLSTELPSTETIRLIRDGGKGYGGGGNGRDGGGGGGYRKNQ